MARPKRTLPKAMRRMPTLDELEHAETEDWRHDYEERERKNDLKYKRADELLKRYAGRDKRK